MPYANTDFVLVLLKEDDWLRKRALDIYKAHRTNLSTSVATIIELLLLAKRFSLDPERLLASLFAIVSRAEGISPEIALTAAHYIKEKNFHVFDAVHAAYCGDNMIISSDKIFDTIGMKRIAL